MGGAYDYTIQPEANIRKQSGGLVFYYVFRYPNEFTYTILFWLLFLLLLLLVAGIACFFAIEKKKLRFSYNRREISRARH